MGITWKHGERCGRYVDATWMVGMRTWLVGIPSFWIGSIFIHGPYTSKLCLIPRSGNTAIIWNQNGPLGEEHRFWNSLSLDSTHQFSGGDLGDEVNPLEGYNPFCPPTISVKWENLPQKGRELRHMYTSIYIYIFKMCYNIYWIYCIDCIVI